MIYQDTLRFLKQHIKNITPAYQWSEADNTEFFNMMYKRYAHKEIIESISEIQEAFKDIFQSVGKLIFKYDNAKGILFKIVPYSVSPKQSTYLPKLVQVIQLYTEQIDHAYSDLDEQLIFKGEAHQRISAAVTAIEEPVNHKELIKEAIRVALKLSPKDIVLILKRKYIVKLHNKEAQKAVQSFSEADLAVDYKDFFEDINHPTFLDIVIDSVTSNALDFDYMDNGYYEQYALKEIRDVIVEELNHYLEDNSIFIKAFAGYILKRDIVALHERIAKALLSKVVQKSKPAVTFLEYYSGETILIEGKKYKMPTLETPDGGKLNLLTVNSVAAAWLVTEENRGSLCLALHNITKILNSELNTFNSLKENFETQKRAAKSREALLKLQKDLRDQEEKVQDINQKRQQYKQQIHKLDQKLTANEKSFKTVLTSLTKALMKRKKAL